MEVVPERRKFFVTHTFGRSTTVVIPREFANQFKLHNANVKIEAVPEKQAVLIRSIEESLN